MMKTTRILTLLATSTILSVGAMAHCGNCAGDKTISSLHGHADKNLVGVAAETETFATLVAAVKAAGLVETLQGKGIRPFQVHYAKRRYTTLPKDLSAAPAGGCNPANLQP